MLRALAATQQQHVIMLPGVFRHPRKQECVSAFCLISYTPTTFIRGFLNAHTAHPHTLCESATKRANTCMPAICQYLAQEHHCLPRVKTGGQLTRPPSKCAKLAPAHKPQASAVEDTHTQQCLATRSSSTHGRPESADQRRYLCTTPSLPHTNARPCTTCKPISAASYNTGWHIECVALFFLKLVCEMPLAAVATVKPSTTL